MGGPGPGQCFAWNGGVALSTASENRSANVAVLPAGLAAEITFLLVCFVGLAYGVALASEMDLRLRSVVLSRGVAAQFFSAMAIDLPRT